MRAEVSGKRCQGAGMCVAVAPDLFDLGADGLAFVLHEVVPAGLEEDAREAETACPAAALHVTD